MSLHSNPRLAEIDRALSSATLSLHECAIQAGFIFRPSGDNSADVPHHTYSRKKITAEYHFTQGFDIRVDIPINERLEKGWYPAMPFKFSCYASIDENPSSPWQVRFLHEDLANGTLTELTNTLLACFEKSEELLEKWTPAYVARNGKTLPE